MAGREIRGELQELQKRMAENERQLGRLLVKIEDLEGASDAALQTVAHVKRGGKQRQDRKE